MYDKLLILIGLCLSQITLFAEPFSYTSNHDPGSREMLRGTFSGEYTWAPPILKVRLDKGTIESLDVDSKPGKPIQVWAILCKNKVARKNKVESPFYERVRFSKSLDLKRVIAKGDIIDLENREFDIPLDDTMTEEKLADLFLAFQVVVTEKRACGWIVTLESHHYLFSNQPVIPEAKKTAESKEVPEKKTTGRLIEIGP